MNRKVLLVADHAFLRDALAEVLQRVFPLAELLHVGRLHAARAALRAGAVGYLPKTLTADETASIVTFLKALKGDLPKEYIAQPKLPESGPNTPKA